jgi:hypothetical protein
MQRLTSTLTKILTLSILLLGVVATTSAQNVDQFVGDIPAGQQVTVTYDVVVNDGLPAGLQFISNQGIVTGANFGTIVSSDPAVAQLGSETRTPVGFTLEVTQLPATGETPWTRIVILSGIIALTITGAGLFMRGKLQRQA